MAYRKRESHRIQSVTRALDILKALAAEPRGVRLHVLSAELSINPSTLHHILKTMEEKQFVELDPETHRYQLGLAAFIVGNAFVENLDLRQVALLHMERLVDHVNESSYLGILNGGNLVNIARVDCRHSIRPHFGLGEAQITHSTAQGKVLLTTLAPDELTDLIAQIGLPRYTENTITTFDALQEQLCRVSSQGWALDYEEYEVGLCCLAAPIRSHNGKVVAALSISLPTQRYSNERTPALVRVLKETAYDISLAMGYTPPRLDDSALPLANGGRARRN